jgi:hypothetical protein
MSESNEKTFEQASAFQKIWMETFTKMAQSGLSFSPESAPPEFLRQMRSGIFQALSKSWEEFMRSPQFLDSMKTMMENAITFRKMSNDLLTDARHAIQGTARSDIDDVMKAIHHLEKRVLDNVEQISTRLDGLEQKLNGATPNGSAKHARPTAARAAKRAPKRSRAAAK